MSHSHHSRPHHITRPNQGRFPQPNRSGDKVNYHVLKCRPILNRSSPQTSNQHLQVLLEIESGQRFWMTINIRNQQDRVLYFLDENYQHPITQKILDAQLPQGFTKLPPQPGGIALDYIRENLFTFSQMVLLEGGPNDPFTDLSDMITTQLTNAFRFDDARMFVFGSMFTDGVQYSSYHIATGIHDIHQNQGSKPPHAGSNGIYQDGGLLIYYPTERRWSAVFLRFESQAIQTNSQGNPI